MLNEKINHIVTKYKTYYDVMKQINFDIWKVMDILRDGSIPKNEYSDKFRECIELNDVRFRIKNKINNLTSSKLKEQKGYNTTYAIIDLLEISSSDLSNCNKIILYYSLLYDSTIVICNNDLINILKKEYDDISYVTDIKTDDINNHFSLKINDQNINNITTKLYETTSIFKYL